MLCAAFYWNIGQVVLGTKLVQNKLELQQSDPAKIGFSPNLVRSSPVDFFSVFH